MALKSTIFKAQLSIADIDHGYYADHTLTLAANLTRFAFGSLKSAPRVLGSPNWIVPGAEMETSYFPQADDIIEVVTSQFYPEAHSNRRGIRNWDDRDLARNGLTLASYGLAQPRLSVTFSQNEDGTGAQTLQVGDATKDGKRLYVLSPDRKWIHVVRPCV